jgi:isoquinoline 1-oxidoreductase alpha subunit
MITLQINGQRFDVDADPETPLLWVLRDTLGLTGTKYGCGIAQCGACTVYVDGEPTRACVIPTSNVSGKTVTTIEGNSDKVARTVQAVWAAMDVPQCGYCQSGQVMVAATLLRTKKKPTDRDIDDALSGNLCRCATYHRIRGAIHEAARRLEV